LSCAQEPITGPCFSAEADSPHISYPIHFKTKFNFTLKVKVKIFLFTCMTEFGGGGGRSYSSTHSKTRQYVGISDEIHELATLFVEEKTIGAQ
jgi:hypothetical protein